MKLFKLINLNFTRFISDKKNFALMMLLPIIFMTFFFTALNYYNKGNFKKIEVGIVNLDKDRDIALIISLLEETPSIKDIINFNDFHSINNMVDEINKKNINCGITIPEEFIGNIYHNDKSEICFYTSDNRNLQTIIFKSLVYEVVDLADYMRNSLDILWENMKTHDIPDETRVKIYNKEAQSLIMNTLTRNSMFKYENRTTIYIYYLVYIILVFMYLNLIVMYRNMSSSDEININKRIKLMNYSSSDTIISKGFLCISVQFIVNLFFIGFALMYLKVNIITILINISMITIYNGMFIMTILNLLPYRNISFIGLISVLIFMIFNNSSKFFNPLNRSMNMIFDTLNNGYFVHYRSILISVAAMILMNILIVIIKKFFIIRKEGVYNGKRKFKTTKN